jgi:hypothetical protein
MQKTGIIKQIQPNGGYQSSNGYISTFMMTIEVAGEGQVTGEIGSKTQTYPMNPGDEITFEMNNTAHGVKLKKVNPQYAQGGSQGQQNQPQGSNSGGRDYDAENRGKCRTQFIKAAIIGGQIRCRDFVECDMLVRYAMTGDYPPVPQTQQQAPDDSQVPF